ncbi:DUF2927 domain-containing protein [Sulfitobacter sp. D35]|uniref:DUF2927 domain-containing protein n=1 Tax=Sulfitobacter sp. D35 TaxID=3083252 RepID=UPI00296F2B44|nr:DUF2927 domain-containing protein [Sulfitobacter sp. D35]MDW4497696.1 DUF2927 domain-containing protein [Sulfitobacter sp. D35]
MSARRRLSRLALPVLVLLHACAPVEQGATPSRAAIVETNLPPMKRFEPSPVPPSTTSNADLTRDFLDLSFALESGRGLPVFTRFEGPITLRLSGRPSPSLSADLTQLLTRLRNEAGIDIRRSTGAGASITIEAVSSEQIRTVLPQAACFVAPNVGSFSEYRANRRNARTNWTLLKERTRLAIFLPADAPPQEIRDCLHEELAQSLGPLNDLYRLPDSVFNDDNMHSVLTAHDMLILRATYAPELRSGMSREQVAARLPGIFARINPAGAGRPARYAQETPREWRQAIETALGPGASYAQRSRASAQAVRIAVQLGWQDQRRAFAHYARARVLQPSDPGDAYREFLLADRYYARSPQTRLHRAYVASQLAAYAVAEGDGAAALSRLEPNLAAAAGSENAALLATLMLLKAEALELVGRDTEARAVRLDSLGWARYGFGPDWAVRDRQSEIAGLNPLKGLNRS